jgi:hypothetical protein
MFAVRAASRMVVPAGTATLRPSMVRVTMVIADPPIIKFRRRNAEGGRKKSPHAANRSF